jgi:uncharacterized membrane protein
MGEMTDRSFSADFKRSLYRGLAVLLPSILTLWIIVYAYRFIDSTIAAPINAGLRHGIASAADYSESLREKFDPQPETLTQALQAQPAGVPALTPEEMTFRLRRANIEHWWAGNWLMDLIGLVVAIIAVYISGRLLGGFFGRRIWRSIEGVIVSVPVFKQIYPSVKQMVDFLFAEERPIKFNRVVMVQYPTRGIWSLGFVTGEAIRAVVERTGASITVFVPCSPVPFSGFTVSVPATELIEVPLSIDEAVRFLVSGGVLVPPHQAMGQDSGAAARAAPAKFHVPSGGDDRPPASAAAESLVGTEGRR